MDIEIQTKKETIEQIVEALKAGETVTSKWAEIDMVELPADPLNPRNSKTILSVRLKSPLGESSIRGNTEKCMLQFAEKMVDEALECSNRWARMMAWNTRSLDFDVEEAVKEEDN